MKDAPRHKEEPMTTEKQRLIMHAWFYEELIRRTKEIMERWLEEGCADWDLLEWNLRLPEWINDTVLTANWPESCGQSLNRELRDLAVCMNHLSSVAKQRQQDPNLKRLTRREATGIAKPTGTSNNDNILTQRFQKMRDDRPSVVDFGPS